jgi:uncharacterized membrane protein YqjE
MATAASRAESQSAPSLIQSLRAYLATWVDLLRTRLELVSTELQEERARLEQILILGAAALVCLIFGLLLVTFFIVVAFWDTNYRLAVVGALALAYLAAGSIVGLITRRKSRQRPKLLAGTLEELAKDYRQLSSRG